MMELLAPAGNEAALKAAIANGCDAIYLGLHKFGARAYSSNFDMETLAGAVKYAHLRDVKIYVTMNTIVFEDEIDEMQASLRALNDIGVDGVIVQDMAVLNYVVKNFEDMEAHCSTQMGIDDLDGAMLAKELGAKRVVLSREVPIDEVKRIRRTAKIPVEVFVHGALCVSYSGNCLMSGLIGYRSGNRGRCVGSCRKPYEIVNLSTNESLGTNYILSMKDLNTIDYIDEFRGIDSLKIEGRMKESTYVANVVAKYRKAIDGKITTDEKGDLEKTFNRTFTRGYMFGEDKKDITNISRPNNFGQEIGVVTRSFKGMYEISLDSPLMQNDIIRIAHGSEDVNLSVVRLYDRAGNLINSADSVCYIKIKESLSKGDIVYKTKDYGFYKDLEDRLDGEFRRYDLNLRVYAYPNSALVIDAEGLGCTYLYESEDVLSEAINNPTTKDQVEKQMSRLGDTMFTLGKVEFEESGAFIPAKLLNAARRQIVEELYARKLSSKKKRIKQSPQLSQVHGDSQAGQHLHVRDDSQTEQLQRAARNPQTEQLQQTESDSRTGPYLTAYVTTKEQYDACRDAGIETIYFGNVIRRNQVEYEAREGELLIGGYGGIHHYRETNPFVTDYSLNVVNAVSCRELYRLGAKRVTLSYEMNKKQIAELIQSYLEANGANPSLEMIVYGRAPLLFTKYCPLKKMHQCGLCRKYNYELRDEYGVFPILSHVDCTTTILNGKVLNLLDEMPSIKGVEAFRLQFTTESGRETAEVIEMARRKLNGDMKESAFDRETDTRGHFNREIL